MYKHPLLDRDKMTPKEALDILLEGNHRFENNLAAHKDLQALVGLTKDKQHPFASVLSCSDSRAPVEMLFDQALGDVFSVRLAGNVASTLAIGSLEFSTKYLGSKLVMVLGHTSCGAVKAACDDFKGGHIGELITYIRPTVHQSQCPVEERNSSNKKFVEEICGLSVKLQIKQILASSEIISDMLEQKQIGIVGGVYDIATGKVELLQETIIV
ncbi:MAG: carbonic anhydrase [Methylotenera sp.]|nr:carbonic anhydrase [Methylotenera sp.]MDP1754991.1 carbonic anhydrase [Methylotenera sp.]MDP1958402.1 carbonic anhydrase [Methylotenera sp.]MDP3943613.1 carbonic anhydrase [Methylotenera sp.]